MSSFLKTSSIHDETAPSESLVLLLKRSFSRQHHLHLLVLLAATAPALHERDELVGPCMPRPAHAPGRFAKTLQARLRSISAATWSTGVWAVTERDACTRSDLRKFLQNQFSFFVENVRFVIFHPKLALPSSPRFEMRYVWKKTANLWDAPLAFLIYLKNYWKEKQADIQRHTGREQTEGHEQHSHAINDHRHFIDELIWVTNDSETED